MCREPRWIKVWARHKTLLTTGIDQGAGFTGGAGNDTFNALLGTDPADGVAKIATLTSFDNLDGGAGTDTLNVYYSGAVAAVPAATVKNIENVVFNANAATTQDLSAWTGVQSVSLIQAGTAAAQSLTVKGATSVSVKGGSTVAVTDANALTTDTVTTVSVDGNTSEATLSGDKITNVTVANGVGASDVTITNATAQHTQNLTLNNNATGLVITDAAATTVNVTTTGKASAVALAVAKAETLTTDGTVGLTLDTTGADYTALKTVNIKGAAALTADLSGAAAVTKIDASTSTGKNVVTLDATKATYTGGAGDETVNIAAAPTKALDGGAGIDTLGLTAAVAAAAVNDGIEALFSNFEKIAIGATGAVTAIDMDNLDSLNYLISAGSGAGFTLGVSNLASGGTFELTGALDVTGAATIGVKDAAAGTADVLNVVLKSAGVLAAGSITAANVETINISTVDTETTGATPHTDTLTLAATSATAIKVSGDAGLTLTNTGNVKVTSFDASGVTLKGDVSTDALKAAAETAAAVTFTSANTTDTATVTITGGAGKDVLTGNAAKDTINGGAGDDTLDGAAGNDALNGGDGNDTLIGGLGVDVLTGGAGKDTFNMVVVATSGVSADTITDLGAGDIIKFSAALSNTDAAPTVAGGQLGAALTGIDASVAVFQDYLDAAASKAADLVSWFQLGGNTYLVQNIDAAATFQNGSDNVVKITGLVDLTNSTFATDSLTIV